MHRAIEAFYENGEIKLLEDLGVKKAKLYIIVIEDETDKENFQWNIDDESSILNSITVRAIEEWHNDEEDKIWK
ncbi:MAG: antitoxin AF2212-like protein [Candidatus Eremiobacterota bacterium]